MRPYRATRAGTQAPPLPISVIYLHIGGGNASRTPAPFFEIKKCLCRYDLGKYVPAGQRRRAHRHRPYPSQPTTRGVPLSHHIVHSITHAKPHGVFIPHRIAHSIAPNRTVCHYPFTFDSSKPHGVPIPHRGYTFDSAGLASAVQPTLGNNASEEATPLGVVLFLIAHHYHTRRTDGFPHAN